MDSEFQSKKDSNLEYCLQTPRAVLSTEGYTEEDSNETDRLIKEFLAGKFYLYDAINEIKSAGIELDKTELEEIGTRNQTITELKAILKEWIVTVAMEYLKLDEKSARAEEARIFPFGSHRLGVNSRGGDIDILVLCPTFVDRDRDFFGDLFERLKAQPGIEELVKVNDPRVLVPVIKLTFHNIPIDLAFAKFDLGASDDLNDNRILPTSMDEKMVYSINGPRNVDGIIRSVDPENKNPMRVYNFRTTLKLLKLWAKNRGIYSNVLGYVTGISLAILVAKICQLYPNLKPNKLIEKFFIHYSEWDWENVPVLIEPIRTYENLDKLNEMQWYDPKSEIGQEKINNMKMDPYSSPMMVATPAFPVMNSTRKVNKTTLTIIKQQLMIGREILQKKPVAWHELFKKINFFEIYYNFIEVSVVANDQDEFNIWKGYVESQIIKFTQRLEIDIEKTCGDALLVHPYPVAFERQDPQFKFIQSYYYGLRYVVPPTDDLVPPDLYYSALDFISKLDKKRKEYNFQTANLRILHLLRNELPSLDQPISKSKESNKDKNTTTTAPPTTASANANVKRGPDYSQDADLEPQVTKKVHTNKEEESTNVATNHSSSPKDSLTPPNGVLTAQKGNGTSTINRTTMVEETKVTQPPPAKKVEVKPQPKVTPAYTNIPTLGKTDFKVINASSHLQQGDELDDFL